MRELERIIGIRPFSVAVIKAPIFHCFAIIIFLTIHGNPEIEELEAVLKKDQRFKIFVGGQTPTPFSVAGKDEIFVKISKNADIPSRCTIWAVADNFRSCFEKNAVSIIHRIVSMQ